LVISDFIDLRRIKYMFKQILFILSILVILSTSIGVAVAGTIQLPKTGQTTSYAAGDDGAIQAGVAWPRPRFADNGDQTITDNLTGLVWTKDAGTPTVGACTGGTMTWQSALDYVACLNTSNYLGHNDWRLPNVNELESLINRGQVDSVAWLNTQGFTNTASHYWSSTSYDYGPDSAWGVSFASGYVPTYNKPYYVHARCVRGGQSGSFEISVISLPQTGQIKCYDTEGVEISCASTGQDGDIRAGVSWPNPRFTNSDGTTPISGDLILDKLTGLEWTKDAGTPTVGSCTGGLMVWQSALDYVACLNTSNYLGHNDWRLPNVNELKSLINRGQENSAAWLNSQGFTNNTASDYWSSTTNAYAPDDAWSVYFYHGGLNYYNKGINYGSVYVQCVRGGIANGSDTNTPSGSNVRVTFPNGASVTYSNVASACNTTFTDISNPSHNPPPNFNFIRYGYFDISTDCNYTGPVTVVFPYDESQIRGQEQNLKLFHWKDNGWEDCTVSVDILNNTITGRVTSLSDFGVVFICNELICYDIIRIIENGYTDNDSWEVCLKNDGTGSLESYNAGYYNLYLFGGGPGWFNTNGYPGFINGAPKWATWIARGKNESGFLQPIGEGLLLTGEGVQNGTRYTIQGKKVSCVPILN
jgi:hypothetical protein